MVADHQGIPDQGRVSRRDLRQAGWQGIGAPTNTPAGIADKLNEEINAGPHDAKIRAGVADAGDYTSWASSPAELRKFIAKWQKVSRTNISGL
jgi:tripartite-type tricarboxylate transporter receptor subunit TctC